MGADYLNDPWLSGFTDGEGSFILMRKRQPVRVGGEIVTHEIIGVQPVFTIALRADDVAVLIDLRSAFGGSIQGQKQQSPDGARNPRYNWVVGSKKDLARIVSYFERFPLRAKKARDFAIWREAVRLYIAHGARAPELWGLRDALKETRIYISPNVVVDRKEYPTRAEVAALAGVSVDTVKRVTGGKRVRLETAARVQAAIEELGFVPGISGTCRVELRMGTA